MSVEFIKKSLNEKQRAEENNKVKAVVENTLKEIELKGDSYVRELSEKFDKYSPSSFRLSEDEISKLVDEVSDNDKEDIRFAQKQVRSFAEAQLKSLSEIEVETQPGVILGHKNIPVQSVGCYVPAGKFPMVASAHMSVVTASVAGVPRIIATTPPYQGKPNAAVVTAMKMGGAHEIYVLGGMQGVGAMAIGTETIEPVDMIVGPGNAYVAEAKRQLFGKVGIDLFAGPTEIAVIADETADPEMVAYDLVGQAEHGYNSPAWLFTKSKKIADYVLQRVPELIEDLPDLPRENSGAAWRDYGEVILCDTDEEIAKVSDDYAPEHLEVQTKNLQWYHDRLKNYGSLFIGEETTVAYGDKCSGTNHILPTKGAGKYTGGLFVGKFIKTLSFQRMSKEATKEVGAACARISRYEGMEAHARTGDVRLRKYGFSN